MGILDFLFGDKTEVWERIEDSDFGLLIWDEDEESWKGTYAEKTILLSFEKGNSSPSEELKKYALTVLQFPGFLESALRVEKQKFAEKYPSFREEVSSLSYDVVNFYRHKPLHYRIIASLKSGKDFRAWRIEFSGFECEGIGFDN